MRKFLLACSVILTAFSCNNSSPNDIKKDIQGDSLAQTIGFTCNYPEYKTNSKKLFNRYMSLPSSLNKQTLLNNIRDSLFTCWLGTPWDFYGTTEEPNNGKIACGYFVTTLLRDIGVKVNRIKHAQCASEEMIKAVCMKNSIYRFSNKNISYFIDEIKKQDVGLYIVGLDFHTGFILNDVDEVYFIHANYSGKKVVEKEIASTSAVLATSKYKVIGKVF